MSKKEVLLKYNKILSISLFLATIGIYFLAGYINGSYPTYEDPITFQLIYGLLAAISLGSSFIQSFLAVKHGTFIWKIASVIFSAVALLVSFMCALGVASVNFF